MSKLIAAIASQIEADAETTLKFFINFLGSSFGQKISEEVATIITGILIQQQSSDVAEQQKIGAYVYSVANGVYTLCDGQLPTVGVFSNYIKSFTDGSDVLGAVVTALEQEYSSLYPELEKSADASKAVALFMAIAQGVELAASKYVPATPAA